METPSKFGVPISLGEFGEFLNNEERKSKLLFRANMPNDIEFFQADAGFFADEFAFGADNGSEQERRDKPDEHL